MAAEAVEWYRDLAATGFQQTGSSVGHTHEPGYEAAISPGVNPSAVGLVENKVVIGLCYRLISGVRVQSQFVIGHLRLRKLVSLWLGDRGRPILRLHLFGR